MLAPLLAAETTEVIGTVSVAAVLVTAFGYALSLLTSGTKRRDEVADERVAEAEAERDRARAERDAELGRMRAEYELRLQQREQEIRYWRARALGEPAPPEEPI